MDLHWSSRHPPSSAPNGPRLPTSLSPQIGRMGLFVGFRSHWAGSCAHSACCARREQAKLCDLVAACRWSPRGSSELDLPRYHFRALTSRSVVPRRASLRPPIPIAQIVEATTLFEVCCLVRDVRRFVAASFWALGEIAPHCCVRVEAS